MEFIGSPKVKVDELGKKRHDSQTGPDCRGMGQVMKAIVAFRTGWGTRGCQILNGRFLGLWKHLH